ncbi:rhomboid family intramembrane serine protease [Bacteroides reticulotermitis]|uniref:rhomboid family intramembrane serine protease n=1 Tax=Bacteroides reticulotermitis TaxID=1133319 RepID=UPI003A8BB127
MKYIFILIFLITYCSWGLELGYTTSSPLWTHLTYMFQHSGIMHLTINSVAFIIVFHGLQKILNVWTIVILMLLCGFAASFLSMYDIPTVGASSMIYAMIGLDIGLTLFCRQIRIANTRRYLLFLFCLVFTLLVSLLKQNSNFFIHLYSLILGVIVSLPLSSRKG